MTVRKVQKTKTLSYGRSCQRCKLYFVTTDSSVYTCPWCSRSMSGEAPEISDPWADGTTSTQMLGQEQW